MELKILLFIIYSSIAGVIEAILYARKGAETWKWNEHALYILNAVIFAFGVFAMPLFIHTTFIESVLGVACCALCYPFFHDGLYYESARQINRKDYRFWSNSKTSTAKIEITWNVRLSFCICAFIIVVLKNIYL